MTTKQKIAIVVAALAVIAIGAWYDNKTTPYLNQFRGMSSGGYLTQTSYTTVATGNNVVMTGPFRLEGIILGSDTASASVSLTDTATTNNLVPFTTFTGSTLHGYYPLGLDIVTGLDAFVTSETGVTIIYSHP